MENEVAKKSKISKGEITWIVISSVIAAAGLFMSILGIVGDHLPVKNSENWILLGESSFESVMKMNYRWFGVILIIGAAFISVLFLNHYAKKGDIDEERNLRRQQRLQVISASADADKQAALANNASTVEVKSTEVKKD
jgi:hypothetical protein